MKYNCDKTKQMLSLYIDDELSKSEKEYIAEHLLNCANCRQEFDDFKLIISELNTTQMQPLPLDFKEKLHNRLVMEKSVVKKKPLNLRIFSSVAAGVILTILIGTGYYQKFQPIDNAYVNDTNLNYEEKVADIPQKTEQKQEPTKTQTPIKNTNPSKKEVAISQKVETEVAITPSKTEIVNETPPQVPIENIALNTEKADIIVEIPESPIPIVAEKSVSGGSPMAAMSARSFAEVVYKTANVKVDNFTDCSNEINEKYGSIIDEGKIVLYINDEDLENVLKIAQKYNPVIIYDNVSAKNTTNKIIISSK